MFPLDSQSPTTSWPLANDSYYQAHSGLTPERTLSRYLSISTDAKKDKLMKAFENMTAGTEQN